jgi:hypothetical protein
VQQDFEYRTEAFFFAAPITRWQYLGGRYSGAVVVLLLVFTSIGLGIFCGTQLPMIDHDRLGPSRLAAFAIPYATVLLPNLLFVGGVFFCLAALTRRMLPVYLGSALCLIGYLVARALLRDLDNKTLAALIDPFGTVALSRLTEYWTIDERNLALIPLEGVLLWNRLLWTAVAAAFVAFSYVRFRSGERSVRTRPAQPPEAAVQQSAQRRIAIVSAAPRPLAVLPGLVWLYFRETVKNVYFAHTRSANSWAATSACSCSSSSPSTPVNSRGASATTASTRSTTRCRFPPGCRSWRSCSP